MLGDPVLVDAAQTTDGGVFVGKLRCSGEGLGGVGPLVVLRRHALMVRPRVRLQYRPRSVDAWGMGPILFGLVLLVVIVVVAIAVAIMPGQD